jgi:hypothetical protein
MLRVTKSILHLSVSEKMEVFCFDLDPQESGCLERCDYGVSGVCYVGNNHRENYKPRKAKLKRNLEFLKSNRFDSIKFEILKTRQRQFRWFGAGDLPDFESLKKIVKVCEQLPAVQFWLPTSRDDLLFQFFDVEKLTIPKNLTIRLSAPIIGEEMPAFMVAKCREWRISYSQTTLDESKATCHASKDGSSCDMCEDCFLPEPVTYLIHGRNARNRAQGLKELRK